MDERERTAFEIDIQHYVNLKEQERILQREIEELQGRLKEHIKPGDVVTVGNYGVHHITQPRTYFDQTRFKNDNPKLYSSYCYKVQQNYLRVIEAPTRPSKRKMYKSYDFKEFLN
jgi:hypothetical protein